jgi:hypothetical protein
MILPEYDPWEPSWPESSLDLPDYPRLPFDRAFWTWRIPESDIRAFEAAEAARRTATDIPSS